MMFKRFIEIYKLKNQGGGFMDKKAIPVGIENFETIIKENSFM